MQNWEFRLRVEAFFFGVLHLKVHYKTIVFLHVLNIHLWQKTWWERNQAMTWSYTYLNFSVWVKNSWISEEFTKRMLEPMSEKNLLHISVFWRLIYQFLNLIDIALFNLHVRDRLLSSKQRWPSLYRTRGQAYSVILIYYSFWSFC